MARQARKGRILKVKTGYNPNSSSVGSNVPEFLFFALGSGFLVAFALNLRDAVSKRVCSAPPDEESVEVQTGEKA